MIFNHITKNYQDCKQGIVNLFSCDSEKLHFTLTLKKTLVDICQKSSQHDIKLKTFLTVSSSCT